MTRKRQRYWFGAVAGGVYAMARDNTIAGSDDGGYLFDACDIERRFQLGASNALTVASEQPLLDHGVGDAQVETATPA